MLPDDADEDEFTVDLDLVKDPAAWRQFVDSVEGYVRASATDDASAELILRRLRGRHMAAGRR